MIEVTLEREVKRTERGWGGHFCLNNRCLFRRNTLLDNGKKKIVVSTVGLLESMGDSDSPRFETLGLGKYFETMAFYADERDTRYFDADVSREINIESPCAISEIDADDRANEMHENVVDELSVKLAQGRL